MGAASGWSAMYLPSPRAPVTSATMTLARRLYRLLGSAISRAVSMPVSRAAIFGAASVADSCRVAGVAAAQSAVGTAVPSVLPRFLPWGSSTVNSGTTVAPRCEAVTTRRQSVRPASPETAGTSCAWSALARSTARAWLPASGNSALPGGGATSLGVGGCARMRPVAPGLPRKGSGRSPQPTSASNEGSSQRWGRAKHRRVQADVARGGQGRRDEARPGLCPIGVRIRRRGRRILPLP